jgi:hypothetical protein
MKSLGSVPSLVLRPRYYPLKPFYAAFLSQSVSGAGGGCPFCSLVCEKGWRE